MTRPPGLPSAIDLEVKPQMATKQFADLLRKARIAAGKTQDDVAKKMGLHQGRVAKLESGQNEPTLNTVAKYAKAIGWRFSIRLEPSEPRKRAGIANSKSPADDDE